MAELRRARADLALTFVNEVNWSSLAMNDAVYMQRPFTAGHAKIAELAVSNRIPLWVDYDDDLYSVS